MTLWRTQMTLLRTQMTLWRTEMTLLRTQITLWRTQMTLLRHLMNVYRRFPLSTNEICLFGVALSTAVGETVILIKSLWLHADSFRMQFEALIDATTTTTTATAATLTATTTATTWGATTTTATTDDSSAEKIFPRVSS